jgi:hypothetical protein
VFAAYAAPEEIALKVVMEGSRRITSGNVSICNNNGDNDRINKQKSREAQHSNRQRKEDNVKVS